MSLRMVALARVSTLKKGQDESPDRQLEEGRRWAEYRGATIVAELVDRVSGAKGESDREGLAEAMRLIRARKADGLWVARLDRLGRKLSTLLEIAEELKQRGATLVVGELGGGPVDTSTPAGGLLFHVLGAVAEFIRATYADAALAGKERARLKGKTVHRPREEMPESQYRTVQGWIRDRDPLLPPLSWGDLARRMTDYKMLMPGRRLATGENREAKPWDRATLKRAFARRSVDLEAGKNGSEK